MELTFLTSEKIYKLADLDELRMAMKKALASSSSGETSNIPRNVTSLNTDNALGLMPAFNEQLKLSGYKAVTVYPGNRNIDLNPHQGMMVLLNFETGIIKCLLDGSALTALRTAAVSAAATDILSRKESSVLSIIGAGRQAYEHFVSISQVREIKEVKIFNRSPVNAQELIKQIAKISDAHLTFESDIKKVVRDVDILVSCTSSREPLFNTSDLSPGTHVNAIGSCRPGYREINLNSLNDLNIFVDNFAACEIEADELSKISGPLKNHSTELGQVVAGLKPGRKSESEITFFKSVGIAAEDLFAAELLFKKAHLC